MVLFLPFFFKLSLFLFSHLTMCNSRKMCSTQNALLLHSSPTIHLSLLLPISPFHSTVEFEPNSGKFFDKFYKILPLFNFLYFVSHFFSNPPHNDLYYNVPANSDNGYLSIYKKFFFFFGFCVPLLSHH